MVVDPSGPALDLEVTLGVVIGTIPLRDVAPLWFPPPGPMMNMPVPGQPVVDQPVPMVPYPTGPTAPPSPDGRYY